MDKIVAYINSNVIWKCCSLTHKVEQSGQGFRSCIVCGSSKRAISNFSLIRIVSKERGGDSYHLNHWRFSSDWNNDVSYLGIVGRICGPCHGKVNQELHRAFDYEAGVSAALMGMFPVVIRNVIMDHLYAAQVQCPLCL